MLNDCRRTKQGVRDLNPKGHNARPSCACFRNPEIPTIPSREPRMVTRVVGGLATKIEKLVIVQRCAFCQRDRGSEHDEE